MTDARADPPSPEVAGAGLRRSDLQLSRPATLLEHARTIPEERRAVKGYFPSVDLCVSRRYPATPSPGDDAHAYLAGLSRVVDPSDGDVVVMMQAYLDESGTHDGSPVMCVAGFVYRPEKCLELDMGWRLMLEKHGLPFFHMVECAHGNGNFKNRCLKFRVAAQTEAIDLIVDKAAFGVLCSTKESEFQNLRLEDNVFRSVYEMCCVSCLVAIGTWCGRNGYEGRVAYFFEAGHKSQGYTSAIMDLISSVPDLAEKCRYGSHTFISKTVARPIQSADVLAWLGATDLKGRESGRERRKDFKSLLRVPTVRHDATADFYEMFKSRVELSRLLTRLNPANPPAV